MIDEATHEPSKHNPNMLQIVLTIFRPPSLSPTSAQSTSMTLFPIQSRVSFHLSGDASTIDQWRSMPTDYLRVFEGGVWAASLMDIVELGLVDV